VKEVGRQEREKSERGREEKREGDDRRAYLEEEERRDGLDVKRLGDVRLLLGFDVQEQYARVLLRKALYHLQNARLSQLIRSDETSSAVGMLEMSTRKGGGEGPAVPRSYPCRHRPRAPRS
jgi:hypothetical protein